MRCTAEKRFLDTFSRRTRRPGIIWSGVPVSKLKNDLCTDTPKTSFQRSFLQTPFQKDAGGDLHRISFPNRCLLQGCCYWYHCLLLLSLKGSSRRERYEWLPANQTPSIHAGWCQMRGALSRGAIPYSSTKSAVK